MTEGRADLGNEGIYARTELDEAALRASRRERARLRERMRRVQSTKAKCCGCWATGDRLQVVTKDGRAHIGGTMRCGRPWLCCWCSAIVGQERAKEIGEAVRRHVDAGGGVYLLTMTLRHRAALALLAVLAVLVSARSYLVRSYRWRQDADRLGIVGWIKALEVTCSRPRGWHPHHHELIFTERPLSNEEFGRWWLGLRGRWADAVSRYDPSLRPEDQLLHVGVDLVPVGVDDADVVAGYLTKDSVAGAALEVARPEAKAGRSESLGPFEIGELAAGGDRWALARWAEYEQATKGRHKLRWSKGLRARLGLGAEKSDEEIVEDTTNDGVVTDLDRDEATLLLCVRELGPVVCEAAERDGADGAHRVLRAAWEALTWAERVRVRRWGEGRFRETGWEGVAG